MEKISKYDYNVDIPVLLIFFCRDEQLKQVFDEVKKARPSKLYLYQDGARKGKSFDIVGIEKCRNALCTRIHRAFLMRREWGKII